MKTNGLHSVLIQRRLQVIKETVAQLGLEVEVIWVPSADNQTDRLTRVPQKWTHYAKTLLKDDVAAMALTVIGPVTLEQVSVAQQQCADVRQAIAQVEKGEPVTVVVSSSLCDD